MDLEDGDRDCGPEVSPGVLPFARCVAPSRAGIVPGNGDRSCPVRLSAVAVRLDVEREGDGVD